MAKIVVLDGYTLNPGDLSFDGLNCFGDVVIYDRTPKDLVITRSEGSEIVLNNKCIFSREVIDALPKLKYIGLLSTGYNVVDCDYCAQKGIVVTNVPAYSTESVVQNVFGLILELYSKIGWHSDYTKSGKWASAQDFCYYLDIKELYNKTIGIVGYGKIGQRVRTVAEAFGLKVLVYNKGRITEDGSNYVLSLSDIYNNSDIISLNCPLNAANADMINKEALSQIKNSAIVINTARGGLIDEFAVAEALNSGKLAGFGADVLKSEPPEVNNPLVLAKNTIITPHIAWATREARARLMQIAISNVAGYINNKIINKIN